MKIHSHNREFEVGFEYKRIITDCAHIDLNPDEQVTFTTPSGGEYDVTRKSWGFYATPSLNSRLPRFGLRGVLVQNRVGHTFVLLVEQGFEKEFDQYLAEEQLEIITWLDSLEDLEVANQPPKNSAEKDAS